MLRKGGFSLDSGAIASDFDDILPEIRLIPAGIGRQILVSP
jgi:hypothetical protein